MDGVKLALKIFWLALYSLALEIDAEYAINHDQVYASIDTDNGSTECSNNTAARVSVESYT